MQELWQRVKSNLEVKIPGQHISCWFQDIYPLEEKPNSIVLYCPNHFSQKWIENNYLQQVTEEFHRLVGKELDVSLRVASHAPSSNPHELRLLEKEMALPEVDRSSDPQDALTIRINNQNMTSDSKTRNGSPLITGCNVKYQFSNFVVGECNRFAWTAAREVCMRFQTAYNPLYLHSQTGLGKTHLGQAMGHLFAQKNLYLKIRWCTAESFSAEMIYHLKNKTLSAFKQKYRQDCDIFCLDDVHFLRGKKWIQTELCYTLDVLLNEGKQIVLMGRMMPNDLDGFQEELTSRMFSGLTAKIHPPEKETRIAILKLHAANMGVSVPDAVLGTIADTIHNHIRNLAGSLTRILAMSSLLNRPIDQELAEEVLRDFKERRSDIFTLDFICHHVARYFHLEPILLCARSRKQKIYYCRQIAMYLSRKYTHDSLQSIGRLYNRDHASVFHAIQALENKMKSSSRIRREVDFIEEKLLQKG